MCSVAFITISIHSNIFDQMMSLPEKSGDHQNYDNRET